MSPKIMYQTRFEMIEFHKPKNKSFDLLQVSKLMTTRMREEKVCVNIFFLNFCHCSEELHEIKGYVQHYCVHNNMPWILSGINVLNVWQLGLKPMIVVPNIRHLKGELWKVSVSLQKKLLKNDIFFFPQCVQELSYSFTSSSPCQFVKKHLNFLAFLVTHLKGLLHFENVNF
jgi:hypothetical protein